MRELLVLAGAAGAIDALADPPQRADARQRIDLLTAHVPAAGTVGRAVADVQAEVRAAMRRRRATAAAGSSYGGWGG
jgi:hypothetical protein